MVSLRASIRTVSELSGAEPVYVPVSTNQAEPSAGSAMGHTNFRLAVENVLLTDAGVVEVDESSSYSSVSCTPVLITVAVRI
jgi:hypothetical protein